MLAVEVIYLENADHSNANLLKQTGVKKKYIGIAKALFAHAITVSVNEGFDGVLVLKAKTTELVEYYIREFGAQHAGSYDPNRLIIWEDAAMDLVRDYHEVD
jgi:phage-related holin